MQKGWDGMSLTWARNSVISGGIGKDTWGKKTLIK